MTQTVSDRQIANSLLEEVKKQGATEYVALAVAVARVCKVPLQRVEWAIRVLLQENILDQDELFRIIDAHHGRRGP